MLFDIILKSFAKIISSRYKLADINADENQYKILMRLISANKNCMFGKEHNFNRIKSYSNYTKNVPIRDYEGIKKYIEKIRNNEKNILTKDKVIYLSKTSGTTSGVKYIPMTRKTINNMVSSTRDAILLYINATGKTSFAKGKLIFVQGCTRLEKIHNMKLGRLSGIVAHHTPFYLKSKILPSLETNNIEDWEKKMQKIVEETYDQDMRLISGIPPWVIMYFENLIKKTNKSSVNKIFKNFSLMITGGVDYSPYKNKINKLIGKEIDIIETYPASEGFFGFKENKDDKGMRLIINKGIFYEFVPEKEIDKLEPNRLCLKDVELNRNYVLIISTDAGLWSYNTGDIISFISKKPYRIIFCGRTGHFISSFGEHVLSSEIDFAISEVIEKFKLQINEFTVAPQVNPKEGKPYHEWFIEFNKTPSDIDIIAKEIDKNLQSKNIYYKDLVRSNIIRSLVIRCVPKNSFNQYMSSIGKLGGQNKIPRVQNNRKIANFMSNL